MSAEFEKRKFEVIWALQEAELEQEAEWEDFKLMVQTAVQQVTSTRIKFLNEKVYAESSPGVEAMLFDFVIAVTIFLLPEALVAAGALKGMSVIAQRLNILSLPAGKALTKAVPAARITTTKGAVSAMRTIEELTLIAAKASRNARINGLVETYAPQIALGEEYLIKGLADKIKKSHEVTVAEMMAGPEESKMPDAQLLDTLHSYANMQTKLVKLKLRQIIFGLNTGIYKSMEELDIIMQALGKAEYRASARSVDLNESTIVLNNQTLSPRDAMIKTFESIIWGYMYNFQVDEKDITIYPAPTLFLYLLFDKPEFKFKTRKLPPFPDNMWDYWLKNTIVDNLPAPITFSQLQGKDKVRKIAFAKQMVKRREQNNEIVQDFLAPFDLAAEF